MSVKKLCITNCFLFMFFFIVSTQSLGESKAAETKTIMIDGTSMNLAWHKEGIAEYIPDGETLENWTKLVASRIYLNLEDSSQASDLASIIQENNTVSGMQVFEKESEHEVIISFFISSGDIFEFNIFKYLNIPNVSGVVSYQYAERCYLTSKSDFAKCQEDINQRRKQLENFTSNFIVPLP